MDAYLQNLIAKPSKTSAYNKTIGLNGTAPTFLKGWGLSPAFYASAQQCTTKSTIKVFED